MPQVALLALALLALFAGPLVLRGLSRAGGTLAFADGLVLASIGGIVLLAIVPEAISAGGPLTLLTFLAGFAILAGAEHMARITAGTLNAVSTALSVAAVIFHELGDGAALSGVLAGHDHAAGGAMAGAVIAHRIPFGMALWWILRPRFGFGAAAAALGAVGAATCTGYVLAPALAGFVSGTGFAHVQAFVAGSLLHVVAHGHHAPASAAPAAGTERANGVGFLVGAAAVVLVFGGAHGAEHAVPRLADTFLDLALDSAPALLLAFLLAGAMTSFAPASSLEWLRRGRPPTQAIKGMAIGLPLPICSCGVVPLYEGLLRRGAPAAAAMAFLVATPELGVDAVAISVPLLGWPMAVARLVAAATLAFATGWLVGRAVPPLRSAALPSFGAAAAPAPATWTGRAVTGLRTGLVSIVDDTAPPILVGLIIAALAAPILDLEAVRAIPAALDVPLLALIGIPTYVCASAATPLAALFLAHGLSPGAALAFLLTGPATNASTFGVLSRLHGRGVALRFGGMVFGGALLCGWIVNAVLDAPAGGAADALEGHVHGSALQWACLAVVTLLAAASMVRRGARGFFASMSP